MSVLGIIAFIILIIICTVGVIIKNDVIQMDEHLPICNGDMEKIKKTLVIVDFQKDFYDKENGSLYVNGAEKCVEPICEKIKSGEFQKVVLTLDWHTLKDKSFRENGGQWSVHCVQYSEGASVHPYILDTIKEVGIEYEIFLKGNKFDHEEYGAFEVATDKDVCIDNGAEYIVLHNFVEDSSVMFGSDKDTVHEICGLAGDYCVWETYKNLKEYGVPVKPFYEGIAFIGEKFDFC